MSYNNCNPTPNDPCNSCSAECKDIYLTGCIKYNSTLLPNLDIEENTYLNSILTTIDNYTELFKRGIINYTITPANATATLTAAQIVSGYITSTSALATSLTLPTGTLLGAALNAVQGTTLDFYVDNTAGANTVTIVVAVNGILSANAVANGASFGLLTVPAGATGVAKFTIVFTSATSYVFSRTA